MTLTLERIVSGGQTGVDRGALDAALEAGFPAGGWCPADRAAEDGPIPDRYPLRPLSRGGYRARTLQNVLDSDATLILAPGPLTGGTRLTRTFCEAHGKPVRVLDARMLTVEEAARALAGFIESSAVRVLNVAGPRASNWPQGHGYTRDTLAVLLAELHPAAAPPPSDLG